MPLEVEIKDVVLNNSYAMLVNAPIYLFIKSTHLVLLIGCKFDLKMIFCSWRLIHDQEHCTSAFHDIAKYMLKTHFGIKKCRLFSLLRKNHKEYGKKTSMSFLFDWLILLILIQSPQKCIFIEVIFCIDGDRKIII